jgi:subtilase family serine protease
MMRKLGLAGAAFAVLTFVFANQFSTHLSAKAIGQRARILITEKIDEHKLVTLWGNTRPEARNPANDRGPVDDAFPMTHMLLQLRRPAELEQEFETLIEQLTDKTSPNFRQWLMPAEQGQLYGPAQADLDAIEDWLESNGFTVNYIYPNGMVMDVSGTAGQIRDTFHTEIHNLDVRGESHYANMRDPQIPAALAPIIVGFVSMHNFRPQPMNQPRIEYTFSGCGGTCYALAPADFEVIYNLNPLYRLGLTGTGQTIVVVEDSDTYANDVATYRSTFLSNYSGTVTTIHPNGSNACTDPKTNGDDAEADLDAEVASAIAPNASIEVASCADTATFGGLLAVENLVTGATPPAIISMSYGECEAVNGATSNAAFNTAFQTGAAAGVSIFVSAGDSGASSCAPLFGTPGTEYAYPGIGVTGWGETVYNVSVGGTDFEDTYNATKGSPATPVSTYWNSSNTSTTYSSAKSYIPEIPWNDSCAGYLLYNYKGYTSGYGTGGLCAQTTNNFRSTAAGSGGPSNCATRGGGADQTSYAVVDGSCTGYAKPAWQSGIFGNPADGVRDVPDVSMFAANGLWGHYVIICFSDTTNKGTSCAGAPSTWSGFGGTSVAAPTMAAIQALVNEKWGIRAGNPNPTYYSIAKSEYGSAGNSACYSINQPAPRGLATSCVFYDVTQGDTNLDCAYNGSNDAEGVGCYLPSGTYGALSTQALTTGTVTAGGSGYTTAPSCTIGAPSNLNQYLSPSGGTLWAGGTQATCTATINLATQVVSGVNISAGGAGYAGGASCALTGGGGTGATCSVSPVMGTIATAYQPAYGATPGWDFATGIGTVNAYNLVFNSAW